MSARAAAGLAAGSRMGLHGVLDGGAVHQAWSGAGAAHLADSASSLAKIGNRKHSVLPEPVPDVTTACRLGPAPSEALIASAW